MFQKILDNLTLIGYNMGVVRQKTVSNLGFLKMNNADRNSPANTRQLNKLKKLTGLNTSNMILKYEQAQNLIEDAENGFDIISDMFSNGATGSSMTLQIKKEKSLKKNIKHTNDNVSMSFEGL
jgi:hypothetical protein